MDFLKEGLLKVEPGLLLWTIITFGVLLFILWKAAWKPLVNALDSRAQRVRDDIETAEKNRVEAEKLLAKHAEMVKKAREDAAKIIDDGRVDAEKMKSSILEKANNEARGIVERAMREITLAKDKALEEIKKDVVNISTQIAAKIISKNLNPDDQKSIVEDTLKKIRTIQ